MNPKSPYQNLSFPGYLFRWVHHQHRHTYVHHLLIRRSIARSFNQRGPLLLSAAAGIDWRPSTLLTLFICTPLYPVISHSHLKVPINMHSFIFYAQNSMHTIGTCVRSSASMQAKPGNDPARRCTPQSNPRYDYIHWISSAAGLGQFLWRHAIVVATMAPIS
jgi:hypothetical protein